MLTKQQHAARNAIATLNEQMSLPFADLSPVTLLSRVETLGQVFTPDDVVEEMLSLRRNRGVALEPSCGDGAFLKKLGANAVGIEVDASLPRKKNVIHKDFFSYSTANKYSTIIGNPPYVRHQDIMPQTKELLPMNLFDQRSNLYLFFIEKCIRHLTKNGELIFITPRDFLKATSARQLNKILYDTGSFTYFRELGDAAVFRGYSPNCAIWRWQKGKPTRRTDQGDYFNFKNGQIWFGDKESNSEVLGSLFDVKVGAVSGADKIFSNATHGNVSMVCSSTVRDGETRKMIYDINHPCLAPHRQELMKRKIRSFNESNWWEWGRKYHNSPLPRIYVNCKTRASAPFFVHDETAYDGSVLALIPKSDSVDVGMMAEKLNKIDWQRKGFVVDGRLIFSQRSLENASVKL